MEGVRLRIQDVMFAALLGSDELIANLRARLDRCRAAREVVGFRHGVDAAVAARLSSSCRTVSRLVDAVAFNRGEHEQSQ